jgi:hypothetical protein
MSHLAPRFWLPRHQPLRLDGAGFLPDPTDPFGQAANPHAHPAARELAERFLDIANSLECVRDQQEQR